MDESRRFFITQVRVGGNTRLISYFCVGRHFNAPFASCPFFGCLNESSANAHPSEFWSDEPAFKVTDMIAVTIFDKWTNACLEKARKPSSIQLGDKHKLRVCVLHNIEHLRLMFIVITGVPKERAKAIPFFEVILAEGPHTIL
jgi:hypothetical protein